MSGEPTVVDSPWGPAEAFDGIDDAIFVDGNPLEGARVFTIEALFRPDSGGGEEQRFFHVQESGTKDRVLLETRLRGDGRWFLDTYVKTGGEGHTLFAREFRHPVDRWYHLALVVDGDTMQHFVDGRAELSRPIEFAPLGPGSTSIGVRINRVSWFRGAIREIRISRRALTPEEFLLRR